MNQRPLYLQKKWVIGHVIILVVMAICINAAFWQLRRLHATEHHNAEVRAHSTGTAIDLTKANVSSLPEYQRVTVSGSWDAAGTYLYRYPIYLGQEGYWVIEPVDLNDGGTILINKGWITLDAGNKMAKVNGADGGSVQITGLLQKAQTAHDPNSTNQGNPPLTTQTAITGRWVQLISPVSAGDPVPLDMPDLSNGSHSSYFWQWNSFALIALLGWISLVRRATQERKEAELESSTPSVIPGAAGEPGTSSDN